MLWQCNVAQSDVFVCHCNEITMVLKSRRMSIRHWTSMINKVSKCWMYDFLELKVEHALLRHRAACHVVPFHRWRKKESNRDFARLDVASAGLHTADMWAKTQKQRRHQANMLGSAAKYDNGVTVTNETVNREESKRDNHRAAPRANGKSDQFEVQLVRSRDRRWDVFLNAIT